AGTGRLPMPCLAAIASATNDIDGRLSAGAVKIDLVGIDAYGARELLLDLIPHRVEARWRRGDATDDVAEVVFRIALVRIVELVAVVAFQASHVAAARGRSTTRRRAAGAADAGVHATDHARIRIRGERAARGRTSPTRGAGSGARA